jgi:hypothetical protein
MPTKREMNMANKPRPGTAHGSPLTMKSKAAPSFTVTLVEDDLVLVWDTLEPHDQADILARLSAWLRIETTKVEALKETDEPSEAFVSLAAGLLPLHNL